MKTKMTILKSSLTALFLLISGSVFSSTYYICSGATLTMTPDAAPAGTHYLWDVRQGATSIDGYPSTTKPTALPTTAGTYTIILNTVLDDNTTASICPPDAVSNDFIVLPPLTIELGTPSNPIYCAANNDVKSSEISQTTNGTDGFPASLSADLEPEYTYTVSKDGALPAVDGTSNDSEGHPFGSIDATGKYTLTTLVPGEYKITGYVKYKQKSTATTILLGTTGCQAGSTTTVQTIQVTPKPTTPSIDISAN